MGPLRKLADLLVFSNLFVAFAVACLTLQTIMFLSGEIDLRYPSFVFFSTLCLYNFHRAFRMNARSENEQRERRHQWVIANQALFHFIFASAVAGLLITTYLYVNATIIVFLSPVVLISLGYSIPFIPGKTRWIRLRDIPFIKIFLISLVLSWVTVLMPFIFYEVWEINNAYFYWPGWKDLSFIFAARMLFIFAITIPFDIRDLEHDRKSGLRTFPVWLGEKKARTLSIISLVVFASVISFYIFASRPQWYYYAIALIASAVISAIVISKSAKEKKEYFYTFVIEGMMVLQFALMYIAHYLHT